MADSAPDLIAPARALPWLTDRRARICLVFVVVIAAAVRLTALAHSPPGFNQDEAAGAWTAWCLLHTGKTSTGDPWPVFYFRAIGESSTLFVYLLMPFQWLFGLGVWSSRLPGAVFGTASVALAYYVGRRFRDPLTGLLAAGLMAIDPWSVQLARSGHEASITPFLILLPWAALISAGVPLAGDFHRPRPFLAVLAGILTGAVCYGYPAVRLYLPAFVLVSAIVCIRAWWGLLRAPRGALTLAALTVGLSLTFGPLIYDHFRSTDGIERRYQRLYAWDEQDSASTAAVKVARRYLAHFGPDFLFLRGDGFEMQHVPLFGQFLPALLPLLWVGMAVVCSRARESRPDRILLVGLLIYPLADSFFTHGTCHALRSSVGIPVLTIVCAVGGVAAARWVWRKSQALTTVLIGLWGAATLVCGCLFYANFFFDYPRRPDVYSNYHVDLVDAVEWLKPQLDGLDQVVCTVSFLNHPDMVVPVLVNYSPKAWSEHPPEIYRGADWQYFQSYGKFTFLYEANRLERLRDQFAADTKRSRVAFIFRPSEADLGTPDHVVSAPDGRPMLMIYIRDM